MMQTRLKNVLPAVKNIQHTPFVATQRDQLVYTDELVKAVHARRAFHHTPWNNIAQQLNITVEQAKKAHVKGRSLRINEHWSKHVPDLKYVIINDGPKQVVVKEKKQHTPAASMFSDELVTWVLARRIVGCTTSITYQLLFDYCSNKQLLCPTEPTVRNWVDRATRQSRKIGLMLDKQPLTDVETISMTTMDLLKFPSTAVDPLQLDCSYINSFLQAKNHDLLRLSAFNYARALVQFYEITREDLT